MKQAYHCPHCLDGQIESHNLLRVTEPIGGGARVWGPATSPAEHSHCTLLPCGAGGSTRERFVDSEMRQVVAGKAEGLQTVVPCSRMNTQEGRLGFKC